MVKRYTESVNLRFEIGIIEMLDEILENDWCQQQNFNRSDLIRHMIRLGIKNFHNSQPKQREFIRDGQTYIENH